MKPIAIALLLPAFLLAQAGSPPARKLFADFFEDYLKQNPEAATDFGRDDYNDRWTDWSAAGLAARKRLAETYLARLKEMRNVDEADRIHAQVLQYGLERDLEMLRLGLDGMMKVSQMFGAHTQIYQTIDLMPARTGKDYENIIARLRAVPPYVDQMIALFEAASAKGMVQPRVVVDLMAQQLAAQVRQQPYSTALLAAFRRFPPSIPKDQRDRLEQEGAAAFEDNFLPAWRKLHSYISDTYAPKARTSTGLNAVPDGDRIYAFRVRVMTTTRMTPGEIHQLGLKEVARLETEMELVARQTGFSGTVAEFEKKLDADPAQHFHNQEEMLVYCRNILGLAEPELPRLFKLLPRTPVGVRAIPADREAATASHYTSGTPDVTRAAYFNLNAYRPEKQVRYDKAALVLHEAVPGHHLQVSLEKEMPGLPAFRKLFAFSNSAYTEGWGLYAESLGEEMGIYGDLYSRFGRLASERFRAVRLVVDTGLHAMGWSREQARQYLHEHAPSVSLAEIDRYIAMPGQALAYKIGQLKIRELRTRAEEKLGSNFDIRDFHDLILRNGVVPLDVLEQFVTSHLGGAAGTQ